MQGKRANENQTLSLEDPAAAFGTTLPSMPGSLSFENAALPSDQNPGVATVCSYVAFREAARARQTRIPRIARLVFQRLPLAGSTTQNLVHGGSCTIALQLNDTDCV